MCVRGREERTGLVLIRRRKGEMSFFKHKCLCLVVQYQFLSGNPGEDLEDSLGSVGGTSGRQGGVLQQVKVEINGIFIKPRLVGRWVYSICHLDIHQAKWVNLKY